MSATFRDSLARALAAQSALHFDGRLSALTDAIIAALRDDPAVTEALATALPESPTVRALTRRLGSFNGAWWDRFAAEVRDALLGAP